MFIAKGATVVGDVTLGRDTSVFYGAVLRGDIGSIVIGDGSNIQDNVIVHLSDGVGVRVVAGLLVTRGFTCPPAPWFSAAPPKSSAP